ncbi:hypothetical protein BDF22DRAFT_653828 [Syncephalis plumigaleata]|nr:hypothetical protein BDF22DRAFT_653828 [Syncephalis plumigaleata]
MSRTTTTKQWLSSKRLFSTSRRVLNASNAAGTPASNGDSPQKMGALKRLVTVYGRLGLIAYLGVSVVDYACCYLVVRAAGAERVIVMEQWLKENLGRFSLFPSKGNNNNEEDGIAPEILDLKERVQDEAARERALAKMSNGDDATAKSTASAATLLLVAYGLHKLIMPLRVAFTALILPPMVKRFGHITWLVGKNAAKAVKKSPSPSGKL